MVDPATNTSYPAEFDPLPEIKANDKQNDPGIEHDSVHDKAHAVLNALQALVGLTTDDPGGASILSRLLTVEAALSDGYINITESSAFTATVGTHNGRGRYIRAGGDVTFDDAEPYIAGMVFRIRATAAIELIEDGVTLSPTNGGTLQLEAGMGVEVVMTGSSTADVNGLTVAA